MRPPYSKPPLRRLTPTAFPSYTGVHAAFLTLDWGWGDVGAYGANGDYRLTGTNTRTPTLDALARNGTLFTDFHTGQSFCAPSRTTFMTGRYPADLSVNTNWNVGPAGAAPNHAAGLPYQLPTPKGDGPSPWPGGLQNVPHLLQQAGYYTAHYGKWVRATDALSLSLSPPTSRSPLPNLNIALALAVH